MAIVSCPECGKKISDKAAVCEHCGFVLEGQDPDSLARKRQRKKADRVSKLTAQSMFAMLLFVAGIGGTFYFRDETSADANWQTQVAMVVMVIGFIWYIINRARLLLVKRQR